jgi:ribosomal protein S18 acetylase RimI-like enzyme
MRVVLANLSDEQHQAAIVALLDMYCRDQFGDRRPLPEDVRAGLVPGLIKHGGARVFLAFEDEHPVGVAICFVGFSSFKAQPLINIHDIAVAPAFRGRGIGRALLAAVEDEARKLGCCKLTLEVRSDNVVAQQAYLRAGFGPSGESETWFWTRNFA